MINASKEFKEKLKDGANVVNYADVTLSDGTVLHLEPKDFMVGGCQIEDRATDGKFGIGFVIGKTLTMRLANHDERFSQYDFYGSVIHLYVALLLDDGKIERIRKGVYYATVPQTPGDIIEISAVDGMYLLDRDYAASTTIYPATLQTILTEACLDCGIPVGFRQFDNMGFIVQEKPEKATYRQMFSWACQIAGYNARIDNAGYMQLIWYNTALLDMHNYAGGNFRTYPHDTVLDGGDFTDYSTGTVISGNGFADEMPEHIFRIKELSVHTDDIMVTGVRVSGEDDVSELSGDEGYVVELKGNPFSLGKERQVADYLGQRMAGMGFRPFSAQVLGNPLYEPGDIVMLSDRKGNVYYSLLNSVSYTIGAYTQIACEAEDPVRNGSMYVSPSAATAVAEARRNAEKQISEYDKAVQQMNQLAMNAMGFHTTYEDLEDGSRIVYLHDKPALEDSKTIYKQTIDGFFISTDGGKSYTAGFDSQGNVVVNILYAIGIVADWIRTGRFQVRKGSQVTFLADADTGEVRIVADSFSLSSGQTIDSIAQGKADDALDDAKKYADEASKGAVDAQTQLSIFNKLTNNGAVQGIYLKDGKIYINGTYIQTGTISVKKGNKTTFLANADTGEVKIVADEFSLSSGQTIDSIAQNKADSAVNDFVTAVYDPKIASLQSQIDGQIETWYYDYQPTLSNAPASSWKTEADRAKHEGDLFYWKSKGYSYRFFKDGSTWKWQLITDSDITKALADAANAQDTADEKRRIFVSTPKPPYDIGDLWVQGANGDIMRCQVARTSGNYVASDWIKASKYTDNSALNAFIDGEFKESISDLQTQADKKAETWYQTSDPSTAWTTTALKNEHIGDIWFNSTSTVQKSYRWNGTKWVEMKTTPPPEVFDEIDGKAQVFVSTPKPPYDIGDLWFNSATSDIMTCVTARAGGSYAASDWQKRNKYIDQEAADTAAQNAVDAQTQTDILNKLTNNGTDNGIYLLNGKLYVSFSAARGGELTLGGANNTSGLLNVLDENGNLIGKWSKDGLFAENAYIKGNVVSTRSDDTEEFDAKLGIVKFPFVSQEGGVHVVEMETYGFAVNDGPALTKYGLRGVDTLDFQTNLGTNSYRAWFEIIMSNGGDNGSPYFTITYQNASRTGDYLFQFEPGSDQGNTVKMDRANLMLNGNSRGLYFQALASSSSGNPLVAVYVSAALGYRVLQSSSSSIRYKDKLRDMASEDIEDLYKIQPVIAKYKDAVLLSSDERHGIYHPMFIAEDVEEFFPEAVDHNEKGQPENWNYRILIPAMFQMIKSQKEEIDGMRKRLERLEEIIGGVQNGD